RQEFPRGLGKAEEALFGFVDDLSRPPTSRSKARSPVRPRFSPRFCYSYFALYGDPLLSGDTDPYPAGYLGRLAASGVDGVWMQGVLPKLAPFPWNFNLSKQHEERLKNLARLVERTSAEGVGVYLYLNEPRSMPLGFFEEHPDLKGVTEGDHATLCTSNASV